MFIIKEFYLAHITYLTSAQNCKNNKTTNHDLLYIIWNSQVTAPYWITLEIDSVYNKLFFFV